MNMNTRKSKNLCFVKVTQSGKIGWFWTLCLTFAFGVQARAADVQSPTPSETWQPLIQQLVQMYASVREKGGTDYLSPLRDVLPDYANALETKRIKHSEKLYYYYGRLLMTKYFAHEEGGDQRVKEQSTAWLRKCLETPYSRVEALAMMGDRRALLREYPLYEQALHLELKLLNRTVEFAAHRALFDAHNVPKANRLIEGVSVHEETPPWKAKPELLLEIGDIYAQMDDYKRAAHAYQSADICWGVDTSIAIDDRTPHPAWEKLAALYEKLQDWDMALHWRLKQLAGTVEDRTAGGPERARMRVKALTDKVIYFLARIGAAEPVEPSPPPKYDIEKLRRITQLYLDMWFPREAIKVIELMEQVAGKELTADRARAWETAATIVFNSTSTAVSGLFWVVFWDQVWTYDKVVAVHKQAIEWGKKAGWEEARLKKLEDQITKLPDLLKYVKEPKNFQDLLDGKATEPRW
jgi:tetratricopeptide (TPR) repeat protein